MRAPPADSHPTEVRTNSAPGPASIAATRVSRKTPSVAGPMGMPEIASIPPSHDRLVAALAEAVREAILRDAGLVPVGDGMLGSMEHAGARVGGTIVSDLDRPNLTLIQGGRRGSRRS